MSINNQVEKNIIDPYHRSDLLRKSFSDSPKKSKKQPLSINNQVEKNIIDPYHRNDLLSKSFSDLEKFTFDKILTQAKVIDVYDGDTVTIIFYHDQMPIKDSFRLYGYDAPEKKPSKKTQNRELEMKAASIVKKKLEKLVLNQVIWVQFTKEEKYGRLMGDIYIVKKTEENQFKGDELHINQWMIQKGYGNAYLGGQKQEFTLEQLHKICKS